MKLYKRMDAVMALPLPSRVKAVLFVLARRAKDKDGRCWTSLERLAADSGNSLRSTSRAIRHLLDVELIDVDRARGRVAHYKVNLTVAILATQGRQIGGLNRSLNLRRRPRRIAQTERRCSCGVALGDGWDCIPCHKYRESHPGIARVLPSSPSRLPVP